MTLNQGLATLTIPVRFIEIVGTSAIDPQFQITSIFTFQGSIVATAVVPECNSLILLSCTMFFVCYSRRTPFRRFIAALRLMPTL